MSITLSFDVIGPPQGARRHRAAGRGGRVVTFHSDDHLDAEAAIIREAMTAWHASAFRAPLDEPVLVRIETWHARPKRLQRRQDRGSRPTPYRGKPDADNIAKLVLDGITKAGVWKDDTCVADLHVTRRYIDLDLDGQPVGLPRTVVRVATLGGT